MLQSGSPCSLARALEAVEAGVVPVLLRCLAGSGQPIDDAVKSHAATALGALSLSLCSPGGPRQLPEPLRGALRPAVAALAGLLRSTQLPLVADGVLGALANMAMADKALAAKAAAAGAVQLATQWARRPGAPPHVVEAAARLLGYLSYQGDTVPAGVTDMMPPPPLSSGRASAGPWLGGGGGQAASCAASMADGKPLKLCSACRGVSYCSGACQKRHWGQHKGACDTGRGSWATYAVCGDSEEGWLIGFEFCATSLLTLPDWSPLLAPPRRHIISSAC
jgi:hypothetical protein